MLGYDDERKAKFRELLQQWVDHVVEEAENKLGLQTDSELIAEFGCPFHAFFLCLVLSQDFLRCPSVSTCYC